MTTPLGSRILGLLASDNPLEVRSALDELKRLMADISPATRHTREEAIYHEIDPIDCCYALHLLSKKIMSLFSSDVSAIELFYAIRKRYVNLAILHESSECTSGTHIHSHNFEEHLINLVRLLERDGLWMRKTHKTEMGDDVVLVDVLIDDPADILKLSIDLLSDPRFENMNGEAASILARLSFLAADLTVRQWKPILSAAIQEKRVRQARELETGVVEPKGAAEEKVCTWYYTTAEKQEWVSKTKRLRHRTALLREYPVISAFFQAAAAGIVSICLPSRQELPIEQLEKFLEILGEFTNVFTKPMLKFAVGAYQRIQKLWFADLMEARCLIQLIRGETESVEDQLQYLTQLQHAFFRNRQSHWCYNYIMLGELADLVENHKLDAVKRQAFWGSRVEIGLAHFLFFKTDYQDKDDRVAVLAQACYESCLRGFRKDEQHIPGWLFEAPAECVPEIQGQWMEDFTPGSSLSVLRIRQREREADERRSSRVFIEKHISQAVDSLRKGNWIEMRQACLSLYLRHRVLSDRMLAQDSLAIINDRFYPELKAKMAQVAGGQNQQDVPPDVGTAQKFLCALLCFQLTFSGPFDTLSHFFQFLRLDLDDWHSVLDGFSEWLASHRKALIKPEQMDGYRTEMEKIGVLFDSIKPGTIISDEAKRLIYDKMKHHVLTNDAERAFCAGITICLMHQTSSETLAGISAYDSLEDKLSKLITEVPPVGEPYTVRIDRIDPHTGNVVKQYLKPDAVKELWSSEKQQAPNGKVLQEGHQIRNHYSNSLSSVAASRRYLIHAKGDPSYPADEYKVRALWKLWSGENRAMELVVMQEQRGEIPVGPARLVQLTETVSSDNEKRIRVNDVEVDGGQVKIILKEKISDGTLHAYASSGDSIPDLDKKHFSLLFLFTLCIFPGDGTENNYVLERTSEGTLKIVCVDNERAFEQPVRKSKKKEETSYQQYVVEVKTILFCLKEMELTIDSEAVEEFLRLNPEKLLREWVLDCARFNRWYEQLLSRQDKQGERSDRQAYEARAREKTPGKTERFRMVIEEGMMATCYELVGKSQELLMNAKRLGKLPTHFDILKSIEPLLGEIYSYAYYHAPLQNPSARLGSITESQFGRVIVHEKERVISSSPLLSKDLSGDSEEGRELDPLVGREMATVPRERLISMSVSKAIQVSSRCRKAVGSVRPRRQFINFSQDEWDPLMELDEIVSEQERIREALRVSRVGNEEEIQTQWKYFLDVDASTRRPRFDGLHCDWFREQLLESISFRDIHPDQHKAIIEGIKRGFSASGQPVTSRHLKLSYCSSLEDGDLNVLTAACSELIWLDVSQCEKITQKGIQSALEHCLLLRRLDMDGCLGVTELRVGNGKRDTSKEKGKPGGVLAYLSAKNNPSLNVVELYTPDLENLHLCGARALSDFYVKSSRLAHLALDGCSAIRYQAFYEQFPFVVEISKKSKLEELPKDVVDRLGEVLSETFDKMKLTVNHLDAAARDRLNETLRAWISIGQVMLKQPFFRECFLKSDGERRGSMTFIQCGHEESEGVAEPIEGILEKFCPSQSGGTLENRLRMTIRALMEKMNGHEENAYEKRQYVKALANLMLAVPNRSVAERTIKELVAMLSGANWMTALDAWNAILTNLAKLSQRELVESRLSIVITKLCEILVLLKDAQVFDADGDATNEVVALKRAMEIVLDCIGQVRQREMIESLINKLLDLLVTGLNDVAGYGSLIKIISLYEALEKILEKILLREIEVKSIPYWAELITSKLMLVVSSKELIDWLRMDALLDVLLRLTEKRKMLQWAECALEISSLSDSAKRPVITLESVSDEPIIQTTQTTADLLRVHGSFRHRPDPDPGVLPSESISMTSVKLEHKKPEA